MTTTMPSNPRIFMPKCIETYFPAYTIDPELEHLLIGRPRVELPLDIIKTIILDVSLFGDVGLD